MLYRRATMADFKGIQRVRMTVQENQLSDASKIILMSMC